MRASDSSFGRVVTVVPLAAEDRAWLTAETNTAARALSDRVAVRSGMIQYSLPPRPEPGPAPDAGGSEPRCRTVAG